MSGAHFAPSLTKLDATSTHVAFPTAQPEGWSWLAELDVFPQIKMGDDAYVAQLFKVGGLVPISNELVHDSTMPIMAMLGTTLSDASRSS